MFSVRSSIDFNRSSGSNTIEVLSIAISVGEAVGRLEIANHAVHMIAEAIKVQITRVNRYVVRPISIDRCRMSKAL